MKHGWKPIGYKFILLGDSTVGKSSIFQRLSGNAFSQNQMATTGIDKVLIHFYDTQISEKACQNFDVTLFDTVGQERYRSITRDYFRNSQGIVLIYSIVNKESFEHIQSWLDSIKSTLSDWKKSEYMVMLLGNKSDLAEEEPESRMIQIEEAERFCKEQEIYWGGECSAKTFEIEKIKGIFEQFLKQIYSILGEHNNNLNTKKDTKTLTKSNKNPKKADCCLSKKKETSDK